MDPHEVKSGEVHLCAGSPLPADSRFQIRTSPMMLPAARCLPSGLNAQLVTGGTWLNAASCSPVKVSNTFTQGSISAAGSYFQPPGIYCPVVVASRRPSGESASCQFQN